MLKDRKWVWGMALLAAGLLLAARLGEPASVDIPAFSLSDLTLQEGDERNDGGYYTILDEKGEVLDKTIRRVWPGDEFISSANQRYRVEKVEGDTARARKVAREVMPTLAAEAAAAGPGRGSSKVAIYHTHSAESYVPTDGTESIPANGGIFKVGSALSRALRRDGLNPVHDVTPHEPRDGNEYKRSRRTALRLLKGGPASLVDVHRDGVPDPSFYDDTINGEKVTRVRLVVGRQNANMQANLDFAKQVKGVLDQKYPGLIRGIFMARGNYNQDLTPRAMLIEAGTHTNDRLRAERGVSLFADAMPVVLSAAGVAPGAAGRTAGLGGDWRGVFWVVVLLLIGGGGFLLLSTGSLKGALSKLRQFTSTEWANFLGPRRGRSGAGKGREQEGRREEKTEDSRPGWRKD